MTPNSATNSLPNTRDLKVPPADDLPLFDEQALPPRAVKKKKKGAEPSHSPRTTGWRDANGRLPLTVQFLWMAIAGLAAGALAMGFWGAIIWLTATRWGFLATLVGLGVGTGVFWAGGDRQYGRTPAFLAASVAAMMLTASQLFATRLQQDKYLQEFAELRQRVLPVVTSPQGLTRLFADEVLATRSRQKIEIDWSGVDPGLRQATDEELLQHPDVFPEIYPPDVWAEAEQLFEGLSDRERQAKQQEIENQWSQGPVSVGPETSRYLRILELQPQKFTRGDLLYFLLSISLAYALGTRLDRRPRLYYPWDPDRPAIKS